MKFADQFRKPNLKSKPIRNRFQLMVNGLAGKPDSNSEVAVNPVFARSSINNILRLPSYAKVN
jgi:hypothetical protein